MVLIYATHHDERSWPDPERFDPTRFLRDAPPRHRYADEAGSASYEAVLSLRPRTPLTMHLSPRPSQP